MRRFFSIIVILVALVSCEDQVKFNNPAVQGLKDNVLWRSTLFSAVQASDGSLMIVAYQKDDILTLKIATVEVKTFKLGVDDVNAVTFMEKNIDIANVFLTNKDKGDGQIVITEFDAVNNTITGEFNFNVKSLLTDDPLVRSKINFTKGIFYKLPITIEEKLSN